MSEGRIRQLSDRLADVLLVADPFAATGLGVRGYDALLPDPSVSAEQALLETIDDIEAQAGSVAAADPVQRRGVRTVQDHCRRRRLTVLNQDVEFTVSAMPLGGPGALLAVLTRTGLPDGQAVTDFLARLAGGGRWVDGVSERLRAGSDKGLLPVADLVEQAIHWCDRTLTAGVPQALVSMIPLEGDRRAAAWRADAERSVTEGLVPALGRWRAQLVDVLDRARPPQRAGLWALPDGQERYHRAIAVHTTLDVDAQELHRVGLEAVAALEERVRRLGAGLGLADLDAVVAAARAAALERSPDQVLDAVRAVVDRAGPVVGSVVPYPTAVPCAVRAMPASVAMSGIAPHYTRARVDGSRPGTYWVNTVRPTSGTGWDLEAMTFHETVPGHHVHMTRLQRAGELPLLHQMTVTAHSEGWALYAERVAGELGLYSGVQAELGALFLEIHRSARMVVDTGLHALGWSRRRAVDYLVARVPFPQSVLADEVDRYIAWPGQALAYLTGQRHLLSLRDRAQARLGDAFSPLAFHSTVLDGGMSSLPGLTDIVDDWIRGQTAIGS